MPDTYTYTYTYVPEVGEEESTNTYHGPNITADPHAGSQDPIDVNPGIDPSTPAEIGEQLPEEKLTILKNILDPIVNHIIWYWGWRRKGDKITITVEDSTGVWCQEITVPRGAQVNINRKGNVITVSWTSSNGGGIMNINCQ